MNKQNPTSVLLTSLIAASMLCTPLLAKEQYENQQDDHTHVEHKAEELHAQTSHTDHADTDHGHEHAVTEADDSHSTEIAALIAAEVGITTAIATAQTLHQTITSYGTITTEPEQLSHVRARYTGQITSVNVNIGDVVKRGDLLARVESNESLKQYSIKAPIGGTLIQRHANTGEVTQDLILFSIANFDTLWAELRIYPAQQQLVKSGQTVHIATNGREFSTTIQHIIPTLDTPYQLARVRFDNTQERLFPGLMVEAHIVTDEIPATVAVERSAIQTMGEQQGVFIKHDNRYEFAALRLGRMDEQYAEVVSGLEAGTEYVNTNSYLPKADIEKSEAEHQH